MSIENNSTVSSISGTTNTGIQAGALQVQNHAKIDGLLHITGGDITDIRNILDSQREHSREACNNNPSQYLIDIGIVPVGFSEDEIKKYALELWDVYMNDAHLSLGEIANNAGLNQDDIANIRRDGVWKNFPNICYEWNKKRIEEKKQEIDRAIREKNGCQNMKDDEWEMYKKFLIHGDGILPNLLSVFPTEYEKGIVIGKPGNRMIDYKKVKTNIDIANKLVTQGGGTTRCYLEKKEHEDTLRFRSWDDMMHSLEERFMKRARGNPEWIHNIEKLEKEAQEDAVFYIKNALSQIFSHQVGKLKLSQFTSISTLQKRYTSFLEGYNSSWRYHMLECSNLQNIDSNDGILTFNDGSVEISVSTLQEGIMNAEKNLRYISIIEQKTGRDLFSEVK